MEEPLRSTVYFRKDYSTPLTTDTDDFIVGDRVWVNGIKPGYIQYIGETHFSPGDWAGVVLDEPTGKNDGSVGGKKYFYCEPKRGVFCRLERLTRYPENGGKGSPDSGIYRESPTLFSASPRSHSDLSRRYKSYSNNVIKETTTDRSPTGNYTTTTTFQSRERSPNRSLTPTSGRDSQQSYGSYTLPSRPSRTITTVSQTSTTVDGPVTPGPLRIGDKVFVNSTKGVVAGRLRFLGNTDFATGYWAGVQLDEPVGKNDGSIAGKRYFYCPNRYGLFAPAYKVVKADPKRMTTITKVTRVNPK